jgi:hypothetical protein
MLLIFSILRKFKSYILLNYLYVNYQMHTNMNITLNTNNIFQFNI